MSKWKSIGTAPMNGTNILLAVFVDSELRAVDEGCYEWIENSDYDGATVYDWVTLSGRVEYPTHWCELPELETK